VIEESPVTAESVPPTTTTTVAPAPPASLPFTGAEAARLALVGALFVATGTALFLSRRRRDLRN
jgi:LPXTG-motif cell wall-anchored protein